MKYLVALALVAFVAARPDEGLYSDRYDNVDVKEIVENVRLLKSYALCFLGEGRCTEEANEMSKLAPEAVQTTCGKCSENQKGKVAIVMKAMVEKLPAEWEKLRHKYDPEKKHDEEFKNFLDKYAV